MHKRKILLDSWKQTGWFYTESQYRSPSLGTYIRIQIDGVVVRHYITNSVCKLDKWMNSFEFWAWVRDS